MRMLRGHHTHLTAAVWAVPASASSEGAEQGAERRSYREGDHGGDAPQLSEGHCIPEPLLILDGVDMLEIRPARDERKQL